MMKGNEYHVINTAITLNSFLPNISKNIYFLYYFTGAAQSEVYAIHG